jgi:hypothetical protein
MVRPCGSSAPDGDFDLGKPKPVGHVATVLRVPVGPSLGLLRRRLLTTLRAIHGTETVLPVERLLVLSVGLVDQHVLDRLKVVLISLLSLSPTAFSTERSHSYFPPSSRGLLGRSGLDTAACRELARVRGGRDVDEHVGESGRSLQLHSSDTEHHDPFS